MIAVNSADLARFPYSATGLIRATFSDGSVKVGMGSVIGRNDVITALGLIYDHDLGWATDLDFYFGADYNVSTGRFDNTPYSLTSGFRWTAKGYTSSIYTDSNNDTLLQSEAQYNLAVIGLSEEVGLRTGWFGLEPGRDANGQTFSSIGFVGAQGMTLIQTTVDKSALAGVYTSAVDPYLGLDDRSSGGPLFTSDGYLVGLRATTSWWADIGFLYSFITTELSSNDSLLSAYQDTTAPILVSTSPTDEASRVAIDTNLVLTFSESIARGTGTLVLKNSAGTIIESFNIATSSRVTISGATLTVNPTSDLAYSTGYRLEIPTGVIQDTSGNGYAGISTYNFTTTFIKPTVSIEDAVSEEGDFGSRDLLLKISLSNSIPEEVKLTVRTWAGTASTASGDYNGFSERTITIPAGQMTYNLAIEINGDEIFEPNEGFAVEILTADGALIGDRIARGWIIDDDEPFLLPSDTFVRYQWHLYPGVGANVFPVWESWTGKGIKVGVFDQGIDRFHTDLDGNLLTALGRDSRTLLAGGSPQTTLDSHGTAVAGIIAAEIDGKLTVGVAPNASLVSVYSPLSGSTLSFVNQIANAFTYAKTLDILNDSWGFAPQRYSSDPWAFYDNFNSTLFRPAFFALKDLADNGRSGLGTIVVQSAGNSFQFGDDTNLHNFQNSRYIITVAATDYSGDASFFSSQGSSILVSAPGGGGGREGGYLGEILTTDRVGVSGYSTLDYHFISGTSFSAPVVSGVIALILEANPNLGYRDVQMILAYSAREIASDSNTWRYNDAQNWNGGGLHYDAVTHNLGFGMVDALAAARLAESWRGVPLTSRNVIEVSATVARPESIPDGISLVSQSVSISRDILVERVELTVDIRHTWIGDLGLLLTSPSGTNSWIIYKVGESENLPYGLFQDNINFTFNTVLSMGERSAGSWSLAVFDFEAGDIGILNSWSINLLGQNITGDDTYFYSDEYSNAVLKDSSRSILFDSGGTDWINASMVTTGLRLDLIPGGISTVDNTKLSISGLTQIENAIGGDGDDFISGNAVANELWGMRGNDAIFGLAGNDQLFGSDGNDELHGGAGDDYIDGGDGTDAVYFDLALRDYAVSYNAATGIFEITANLGSGGVDSVVNVEIFQFLDQRITSQALRNSTLEAATYRLLAQSNSVKEGESARFTLTTTDVAAFTTLAYQITGVQATDVAGGQLSGLVTIGTNGQATISIPIAADNLTEGQETLTVTVRSPQGADFASANVTISDTSTAPEKSTRVREFTASSGDEVFQGSSDKIDVVKQAGNLTNFSIQKVGDTVVLSDNSGSSGTDTLVEIDRVMFSDKALAFDLDGATSAGGIYRLYKATFNREPDTGGLGYWINVADAETKDAVRMAEDFTWSEEFQNLYGITTIDNHGLGNDIRALIEGFYENVLGRSPDAGGLNYYTGVVESREKTVGRVLAEISDSQENYDGTIELIANGIVFDPWVG